MSKNAADVTIFPLGRPKLIKLPEHLNSSSSLLKILVHPVFAYFLTREPFAKLTDVYGSAGFGCKGPSAMPPVWAALPPPAALLEGTAEGGCPTFLG